MDLNPEVFTPAPDPEAGTHHGETATEYTDERGRTVHVPSKAQFDHWFEKVRHARPARDDRRPPDCRAHGKPHRGSTRERRTGTTRTRGSRRQTRGSPASSDPDLDDPSAQRGHRR